MTRYGAVDAHYPDEGGAHAALVVATEPRFATLVEELSARVDTVPAYKPGFFFERELPAIRAVLATTAPVDVLVVDGYVDLDPDGRPGLGARVHAETGRPVVGVAKTAFRSATHAVPVVRGSGARPLYVTSAGMTVKEAAALVGAMAGAHRIPDALRRVDRLARSVPG
ncbi:endonuclease V [Asanoa ishikariensis]|uniref:Endonuclease V n=1 Tax=Asanoa ishikariensis TaxID=137265 RepID=A0A1H3R983_9ACTN|nr:endonuclease V [Asanoa ishikariensis]GIF64247.1 endonuclease V [Asanoa ishikariensis]SDZ22382.1 Endonuclease V [Asanoa ishikariensis]